MDKDTNVEVENHGVSRRGDERKSAIEEHTWRQEARNLNKARSIRGLKNKACAYPLFTLEKQCNYQRSLLCNYVAGK